MRKKRGGRRAAGGEQVQVKHLMAAVERAGQTLDAVRVALKSMQPTTPVLTAGRLRGKKKVVVAGLERPAACRWDTGCLRVESIKSGRAPRTVR